MPAHIHFQPFVDSFTPSFVHSNVQTFFTCLSLDQIIERANQMGRGQSADAGGDAPYIVQGDIAMTKEQYEEYMAEWKKQEAELIAKGEIKPDK